jgi:serine phosphatase RsbU (regulator of sigma subunit)
MTAPLLQDASAYRSIAVYPLGAPSSTPTPILSAGAPSVLATDTPQVAAVVERASTGSEMAIVDLLDRDRTLGFAVVDDVQAPRFVLYAERRLSPDPNVRRRREDAFLQLRYAIYLGAESDIALLGSSEQDLPLGGRRATTTIPYGDSRLVLVAAPTGRLGDALTANLWWVVAIVGLLATAIAVAVLRRLNHRREEAVTFAGEVAVKHEEQRSIAETLQLGLLPRLLAAPPHTEIASRYWPAGDAQLIGGDFWDVFAIDDDHWGLLIGDICGKGIEAAALTGLVRHTVRTASRLGAEPIDVLRAVHVAMTEHQPPTFCTVCFMTYRPDGPGRAGGELVVSLGGHPQPLLVRGNGVQPVGQFGTVLGMVQPLLSEERIRAEPGDTLVLFTDGLTDAPGDQAVPLAELEELLGRSVDTGVEELADDIRVLKRRRRPSGSADDTAVLVIRFKETPNEPVGTGTEQAALVDSAELTLVVPT